MRKWIVRKFSSWMLRLFAATALRPQLATSCQFAFYATKGEGEESPIFKDIRNKIETNKVVLFMKGTPTRPQCGFSNAVVRVLEAEGLSFNDYAGVNVLDDERIRQGIKEYSDWPTIPQLYINGEFIGGCDIVVDMFRKKELSPLLEKAGVKKAEKK